jgi:signal transduction histidine kinase
MTGVVNPRQSALEVPLCRHHFSRKLLALLALEGDRLRPIVTALTFGGLSGVMAYRRLARSVSNHAAELPKAAELTESVSDLRITYGQIRATREFLDEKHFDSADYNRSRFSLDFSAVSEMLRRYSNQLKQVEPDGTDGIVDNASEWATVHELERTLDNISRVSNEKDWILEQGPFNLLEPELDELHRLGHALPGHLQTRMQQLKGKARREYHALITLTGATSLLAVLTLFLLVISFNRWVFRPLDDLIDGSRRVAFGDFDHRIKLEARDEMAELAAAMNDMTKRFCEIRDDLGRQVKQRTSEVVRSEQMASVGFFAAGVAHEINNPLASIAWCAESLESRFHETLYASDHEQGDQVEDADERPNDNLLDGEIDVLRTYLRRIQDEAFRCKGITEGLLTFFRGWAMSKSRIRIYALSSAM